VDAVTASVVLLAAAVVGRREDVSVLSARLVPLDAALALGGLQEIAKAASPIVLAATVHDGDVLGLLVRMCGLLLPLGSACNAVGFGEASQVCTALLHESMLEASQSLMMELHRRPLLPLALPRRLTPVLLELDLCVVEPPQVRMVLPHLLLRLLVFHPLLVRVIQDHQVPHGHLRPFFHLVSFHRFCMLNDRICLDTALTLVSVQHPVLR
jgi:hypothetical protein